jgi:hypothetical protein
MKQGQEELLLAHLLLLALLRYPLVDFSGNITHQQAVAHFLFRFQLGSFDSTDDSKFFPAGQAKSLGWEPASRL